MLGKAIQVCLLLQKNVGEEEPSIFKDWLN